MSERRFRLKSGVPATEREACEEALRDLLRVRLDLTDRIEALRLRLRRLDADEETEATRC